MGGSKQEVKEAVEGAEEGAAPPEREIIFVVECSSASAIYKEDDPKKVPQLVASITFPGVPGRALSTAATPLSKGEPDDAGNEPPPRYNFNLKKAFKLPVTNDTLLTLINKPVTIEIAKDKQLDNPIAKASFDLLDTILSGATELGGADVPFSAILDKGEAQPVLADARLTATVKTFALPEPADAPEEDADGDSPPDKAGDKKGADKGKKDDGKGGAKKGAADEDIAPGAPAPVLSPDAGAELTVLEFGVDALSPVPKRIADAHAKSKEKTVLRVGARLPTGAGGQCLPLEMTTAKFAVDGAAAFDLTPRRYLLGRAAVDFLRANLDFKGCVMAVEVARTFKGDEKSRFHDPAYAAYHGVGLVDLGALLHPGATDAVFEAPLTLNYATARETMGAALGPALFPAPGVVEGKDVTVVDDSPESAEQCHWVDAGAKVRFSVKLSRSILPPWQRPVPPGTTVEQLVPPKGEPEAPAASGLERFREECKVIAQDVAKEYLAAAAAAEKGAESPGGVALTDGAWQARQRQLRYQLNRSGKFIAIREALRDHVVRVVRERFLRSGDMAPAEMATVYNDLYCLLTDTMQSGLGEIYRPRAEAEQPAPPPEEAARLLVLANEAEECGDGDRAAKLHLQRLVRCTDAQRWLEYARFCARRGDAPRAHEAVREAVALDPGHRGALRTLVLVLLHRGLHTDALAIKQAEVVVATLTGGPQAGGARPRQTVVKIQGASQDKLAAAADGAESYSREPSFLGGASSEGMAGALAKPTTPEAYSSKHDDAEVDWALQAVVLRALGPSRERDWRASVYEALRIAKIHANMDATASASVARMSMEGTAAEGGRESQAEGAPAVKSPFVSAGELAMSIGLGGVALACLAEVKGSDGWTGLRTGDVKVQLGAGAASSGRIARGSKAGNTRLATLAEDAEDGEGGAAKPPAAAVPVADGALALCEGRALTATGDFARAAESLRACGEAAGAALGASVNLARAELYWRQGDEDNAAVQYLAAVNAEPAACPLRAYVRLGNAMIAKGEAAGALEVMLQGCRVCPHASTWLGAGRCYYALGDLESADLALTQANVLDDLAAGPWAWLAAVAAAAGRNEEAEGCARFALKHGLKDATPLREAAASLSGRGELQMAAVMLRRALALQDDPQMRLMLGDVCFELNALEGAVDAYKKAAGSGDAECAPRAREMLERLGALTAA
ncbi:unnamed protein product [Pedinophyceae sp. YPF-701]|nr:unnamed protein product [Pedinophyceae sp. YPF-701]